MKEIPETGKNDKDQDWDMLSALEVLDEKEKTIIILRYFEDWKLREI